MVIEDKLSKTRFSVDQESHIKINTELCQTCSTKPCLYVCPVQNYTLTEESEIEFVWQGCLECGACRIACREASGGIEWDWPRGGFGVCFRFG